MTPRTILGVAAVCAIAAAGAVGALGAVRVATPNAAPAELVNPEAALAPDLEEYARLTISCAMPPPAPERIAAARAGAAAEAERAARPAGASSQAQLDELVALQTAWLRTTDPEERARLEAAMDAVRDADG